MTWYAGVEYTPGRAPVIRLTIDDGSAMTQAPLSPAHARHLAGVLIRLVLEAEDHQTT